MDTLTQTFMRALQTAEQTRDTAPLVALFSEGATLRNLTSKTWEGLGGAAEFWETYLNTFSSIHSEFSHHADTGQTGLMEWDARGQLAGGHDIDYRGVSVIEHDGQKVQAFRTYYDSAAFIRPETAQ
jgi:hypothetical protein